MKRTKKVLALMLAVIICISAVDLSAFAAENKQYVFEGDAYQIVFDVTNAWGDGFQGNVTIHNTSEERIDNWALLANMSNTIDNIWNAEYIMEENNQVCFTNLSWNQDIPSGGMVSFGFIAKGDPANVSSMELAAYERKEVESERVMVRYEVINDWSSGFIARVTLQNLSDETFHDWRLDFDYGAEIANLWGAQIENKEDSTYSVSGPSENQNLLSGQEVFFEFQVNQSSADIKIENQKLFVVSRTEKGTGNQNETENNENHYTYIPEENKQIQAVSVELLGESVSDNQITITENLEFENEYASSFIGNPIDIEAAGEFESARITFSYDPELLGDSKPQDLVIAYWDEADEKFVIMAMDTVLDEKNHTISCETNHFSMWFMIDFVKWYAEQIKKWADLGIELPDMEKESKEEKDSENPIEGKTVFHDYDVALAASIDGINIDKCTSIYQSMILELLKEMGSESMCSIVATHNSSGYSDDWSTAYAYNLLAGRVLERYYDNIEGYHNNTFRIMASRRDPYWAVARALELNKNNGAKDKRVAIMVVDDAAKDNNGIKYRTQLLSGNEPIYVVCFGTGKIPEAYRELAEVTGGKSFSVTSIEEAKNAVNGIVRATGGNPTSGGGKENENPTPSDDKDELVKKLKGVFDSLQTHNGGAYAWNNSTLTEAEVKKLVENLNTFRIKDEYSLKMFLATCLHESQHGMKTEEDYVSGRTYGKYERGAGYIQITGEETQITFLEDMKMSDIPENTKDKRVEYIGTNLPWEASMWYWSCFNSAGKRNLNEYVSLYMNPNNGEISYSVAYQPTVEKVTYLISQCFVNGLVAGEVADYLQSARIASMEEGQVDYEIEEDADGSCRLSSISSDAKIELPSKFKWKEREKCYRIINENWR